MRLVNSQPQDPTGTLALFGVVVSGFGAQAAVAAQNSHVQLFMPAAGNQRLQVIDCIVSLATAGDVIVAQYATPLATDAGAGQATWTGYGPYNAHVRTGSNAGILGTQVERMSLPAGIATSILRGYSYVVDNNMGLLVAAVTVNIALTVTWRWTEFQG